MALDSAAATAAATTYADALIAAHPACAPYRADLISSKHDELMIIFSAIVANAVVDPVGSPQMNVGGTNVTGKGKVT